MVITVRTRYGPSAPHPHLHPQEYGLLGEVEAVIGLVPVPDAGHDPPLRFVEPPLLDAGHRPILPRRRPREREAHPRVRAGDEELVRPELGDDRAADRLPLARVRVRLDPGPVAFAERPLLERH